VLDSIPQVPSLGDLGGWFFVLWI